ncbi:Cupredoxin [Diplogelasinospora grovesii]|uniref:Cupredoxin n=1 Tax=Diplogelasinospora grovesii TaxID=303347 RepID=A0AAN6S4H3_9PEZI|nr:Cupredoxin [Diplogelasinospora grovesii]
MRLSWTTLLLPCVLADTVTLNWSIGWKWLAPDGVGRPVVTVNQQWPAPQISLTEGDRLILHVTNNLGNETTSIHFHGIFQKGDNEMDGPVGVTQCPIPPGSTFTYDFRVDQVGTYWWHAHGGGQIADGLRGAFVIRANRPPYRDQITGSGDLVITTGDWFHDQAPYLIRYYQSVENNEQNGGAEPIPDSGLINDGQDIQMRVDADKTYLLRVVNIGNFVGTYLEIDGHDLTIVEVDGVYTEPYTLKTLYLSVGQRYAVLLKTKKSSDNTNYLIKCALDLNMFDDVPAGYDPNYYGYLVYNTRKPLPSKAPITDLTIFDDLDLVTSNANRYGQNREYENVDRQIILDMDFTTMSGVNRAIINNVTYVSQKVPTLYTALSTGKSASNPLVYGVNSIPFVIKHNDVVEVIINNHDSGGHPWHLHGQTFQVIARTPADGGLYAGQKLTARHPNPLRRDVVSVSEGAFVAIRFKADNPGVYLMHCHIEWHVEAGLTATMIVAPDQMQSRSSTIHIPGDHVDACRRQGIPTQGNAAGNTQDFLNLTGANTQFDLNPSGAVIDPSTLGPPGKQRAYWPKKKKDRH